MIFNKKELFISVQKYTELHDKANTEFYRKM